MDDLLSWIQYRSIDTKDIQGTTSIVRYGKEYWKSYFSILISSLPEVCYPEDEVVAQEVPSDTTTEVQPEAAIIVPPGIPQIDRTRKPMNNQKPDSSPVIEVQEFPIKPVTISTVIHHSYLPFSY